MFARARRERRSSAACPARGPRSGPLLIPGQACSALRCGPDAGTHGACPTASGWILTDAAVDGRSRAVRGRRTRGRSDWGARRVGVGIRSGISVCARPGGQVLSVASDVRSVLVGVPGIPPVVLVMRRSWVRFPQAALLPEKMRHQTIFLLVRDTNVTRNALTVDADPAVLD